MTVLKRLSAALVLSAMLLSLIPSAVFADDAIEFYAEYEDVGVGERIEFTIKARNVGATGMSAALVGIRFDKRLTFERSLSSIDSALSGNKTIGTKNIDRGAQYERRFMWVDDGGGVSADFTLAKAVFTVPSDIPVGTEFDFQIALSSDPKNYLSAFAAPVAVTSESFTVVLGDFNGPLSLTVGKATLSDTIASVPLVLSSASSVRGGIASARFALTWNGGAKLRSVIANDGSAALEENASGRAVIVWTGEEPQKTDDIRFFCRFDMSDCSEGDETLITPSVPDGASALISGNGAAEGGRITASPRSFVYWNHSLIYVPASAPRCEKAGNTAYFRCENCGRLFSDLGAATELSESDVVVAATGHAWGEWKTSIPAKCLSAGEEKRVCLNDPSHSQTRSVPALGHNWSDWVVVVPAECETDGSERRVCLNDDSHIETRTITATGHSWGDWAVVTPATCENDGLERRVCANDASHTETRAIAATGHSWGDWAVVTPASCESDGLERRVCANDGTHTETRAIAATGHSWSDWTVVTPASCEREGLERRVCANDASHIDVRAIDATGHSVIFVPARSADCEADGNIAHYKCVVCSKLFSDADAENPLGEDEVRIAATGHSWGDWETVVPAQYNVNGEERRVCSHNPEHIQTRAIPALWHDLSFVERVEPTCETDGSEAHWLCAECGLMFADSAGNVMLESVVIPATGHSWGAWETSTAATCTADGESRRVCANDASHIETKIVPATGHSWGEWTIATAATCTADGETRRVCANDASHVETKVIPATGHSWGEWTVATAATCESDGESRRVCANDASHVETKVIPATGHAWGEWTVATAATCESDGETRRVCTNDASHVETKVIPATGHAWGEWITVTPATCEISGEAQRVCANDPSHIETKVVPATGHSWGEWTTVTPATCESDGQVQRVCANDPSHTETKTVPATGHAWSEWTVATAATCEKNGEERRVCANDASHVETRTIVASGHDLIRCAAREPLPDENGNIEYWRCAICGKCFADAEHTREIGESDVVLVYEFDAGDVNGDTVVNARDVLLAIRYLTGWTAEDYPSLASFRVDVADFDGNGKINARDVILLMMSIVNAKTKTASASVRANAGIIRAKAALAEPELSGADDENEAPPEATEPTDPDDGGATDVDTADSAAVDGTDIVESGDTVEREVLSDNDTQSDAPENAGALAYADAAVGDVNCDTRINAKDVTGLMRALIRGGVGADDPQGRVMDVNGDGALNARDVVMLMKIIVGIIKPATSREEVKIDELPDEYNDFLTDAVFCGDSICEALSQYGILPERSVIAANGAGVWGILDADRYTFTADGVDRGFADALRYRDPKRVVLWIGLNDTPASIEYFRNNYTALVEAVKEAAPQAELYAMSITPIGKETDFGTQYEVTNDTIDEFNGTIAELAALYGFRFVDVSTALKGEDGCLAEEYAGFDGIHLPYTAYPIIIKTFLDAVFGVNSGETKQPQDAPSPDGGQQTDTTVSDSDHPTDISYSDGGQSTDSASSEATGE